MDLLALAKQLDEVLAKRAMHNVQRNRIKEAAKALRQLAESHDQTDPTL